MYLYRSLKMPRQNDTATPEHIDYTYPAHRDLDKLSRVSRKPDFCICKNKEADQLRGNREVTAKLISAFVFAIRILQFLYYLNPKFQASTHLLWLYSPVCVRPGRKPRRPVFSQRGSIDGLQSASAQSYKLTKHFQELRRPKPAQNKSYVRPRVKR